jgi:hypothetical protein
METQWFVNRESQIQSPGPYLGCRALGWNRLPAVYHAKFRACRRPHGQSPRLPAGPEPSMVRGLQAWSSWFGIGDAALNAADATGQAGNREVSL